MIVAAANVGALERLCAAIRKSGLRAGDLSDVAAYKLGDYVWARWGNSRSVQLAQIELPGPVSFDGRAVADWWCVRIYWPRQAAWRSAWTHRRVYRALAPMELQELRAAGVIAPCQ